MVERAFGGAGQADDLVDRSVLKALFIEQLPRGGDDLALGLVCRFLHGITLFSKRSLYFILYRGSAVVKAVDRE